MGKINEFQRWEGVNDALFGTKYIPLLPWCVAGASPQHRTEPCTSIRLSWLTTGSSNRKHNFFYGMLGSHVDDWITKSSIQQRFTLLTLR